MSSIKRFVALTLTMVMIISAFAMTVSARIFDDVEVLKDPELSAAIDLLSEMGIAKGVSADHFDPDSPVTRQQFALFVSRIHTATPEYFVPSVSQQDLPMFSDVKDNTYFTAINYCYENQIINGIVEPTANTAGVFAPEEGIIFQDAVKMLVSALGYAKTGLSYPVGYLAKAKEIGLLEGFNLTRMKAGDTVTRADMAALLYNYFLNDYIEVVMVWNPVQNQYVANQVLSPVCEKFGITKIVGYVTAVEGAAIPLVVEDHLDPTNDKLIQFNAAPISMKMAEPTTPGNYNIVISYLTNAFEKITTTNYIPVYGPLPTTTPSTAGREIGWIEVQGTSTEIRKTANFKTTKEALGLADVYKDLPGSRELLGLKVVAFVNTRANQNVKLPATVVVGEKTLNAKVSVNDVMTSERIDYAKYPLLTIENAAGKVELDRRRPTDLRSNSSIYVFDSTNGPSAGIANTIETAPKLHPNVAQNEDYMLGMIRTGGAYTIDYADNGFNLDGTRNYAVIFTPFEAIYIDKDDNDRWQTWNGNGLNGGDISRITTRNKIIDSVTYDASSLSNGNAFFISRQGEYIVRHGSALTKLADSASLSYIDNNIAKFTRSVAWASLAELQINYNSKEVFYKAMKNRSQTSNSFTTVKGANAYDMKLQDTYHVFSVSSINPNYGYVGGDSGEFFVFQTGVGNKIDTGKRYGYILSTGNSAQLTNGVLAVPYTIYDLSDRTQKIILDVNNTSSPYAQGTHIVYFNQGTSSQRISGAVDPFSFRTTTNPLTVTGARAALRTAADDLGALDFTPTRFNFGTGVVNDAFNVAAIRAAIVTGLSITPSANYHADTVDTLWGTTRIAGIYPADITAAVAAAADAFYDVFPLAGTAGLEGAISDIADAIAYLEAAPTTGLSAWLTFARTRFESAVVALEDFLTALDDELLIVEDEVSVAIPAETNDARIVPLCTAYRDAIEMILTYVDESIIPAYLNYVEALTISESSITPARNASLAGTPFLSANEAGWVASSRVSGLNTDGFDYNPTTKLVSVGNMSALNNGISATVNTNTLIFIFDAKSLTNVNMITRDQLDAMIPQIQRTRVLSALVVRDEFGQTTNNGTAKVLYIGLDGDDPVSNQYLNSVTTSTSYLKITEIGTVIAAANGVNYRIVKAYDYVSGRTEEYAVSSNDPLFSNLTVGSIVYLSASNVTVNNTQYRVAQLMSNYYADENNQILTNTFLTNMIYTNSGNYRVLNYDAGVGVTTANGTVYNINNTMPVTFINLTVTGSAATGVTAFSINSDETGLKVGATAASGNMFYSKAYDWEGFNSIRKSALDSQLANLAQWTRTGTVSGIANGNWYVVPTILSNSSIGGITLIYVRSTTAS